MRHAAVLAATLLAAPATALDTLTAVHAFPVSLVYTQSFLRFVDAVNARGEGVVKIEVRGGPEAIGMFQQADAVRDGVVDMAYQPASFYAGSLPERDALVSSNLTAIEARANGGIDLIASIHQWKMGVHYLGWFDSGVSYNLWAVNAPKLTAAGDLDVSGIRLRGNSVYNAFFTEFLGAQVIDLPTTEVYAALERKVVDATGWTQIGLMDLRWNQFLNYRVEPNFYSTDLGVIVNLEAWTGLSEASRAILTEVAIAHEAATAQANKAKAAAELAALEAAGMKVVALEGAARARFLAAARRTSLDRMKAQMAAHPMGLTHFDALVSLFYAE